MSNNKFSVGDFVLHSEFGKGKVLGVNGKKLQIKFENNSGIVTFFQIFVKKLMLHKITFLIDEQQFEKNKIIDFFENIVFEKKKKNWKIRIISNDHQRDLNFLDFLFNSKKKFKVELLKKKNWVLSIAQKDKPVITNFFTISQNKLSSRFKKISSNTCKYCLWNRKTFFNTFNNYKY